MCVEDKHATIISPSFESRGRTERERLGFENLKVSGMTLAYQAISRLTRFHCTYALAIVEERAAEADADFPKGGQFIFCGAGKGMRKKRERAAEREEREGK